jgi:RNA polymerase sigma factor (TIGR02999 family)
MSAANSLTEQLRLYASGHKEVGDSLLRAILPRLRQIASRRLSREYAAPVTPTELIDETWLAGLHQGRWKIENREHFFGIASLAMENVLTDMARRRLAQCRGKGAVHLSLDDLAPGQQPATANAEEILAISMLMEELAKKDAKVAFVVRMHYIVGFSLEEIAKETGLTLRQVRHRWEKGKVWLASRLNSRRK